MIHFWNDTVWDWSQQLIRDVEQYTDLNVVLDGNHDIHCQLPNKLFYGGTPHDERLFYPDSQPYECSFVGSIQNYPYRQECLEFIKDKAKINITGGQRENKLSAHDYAQTIRGSMININFSESPSGKYQAKSRVFESIASATLLLESANQQTLQYYTPNEHYIEFQSKEDLLEKIRYYCKNVDEAYIIAFQGYLQYKKHYSNRVFWAKILT
jgi:hypothetical protein